MYLLVHSACVMLGRLCCHDDMDTQTDKSAMLSHDWTLDQSQETKLGDSSELLVRSHHYLAIVLGSVFLCRIVILQFLDFLSVTMTSVNTLYLDSSIFLLLLWQRVEINVLVLVHNTHIRRIKEL